MVEFELRIDANQEGPTRQIFIASAVLCTMLEMTSQPQAEALSCGK